jgi:hypothetical protein
MNSKREVLKALRAGRGPWETVLAGITPARMETPGAVGRWSPKEVVAHAAVWAGWMMRTCEAILAGRAATDGELHGIDVTPELDAMSVDEFNEWMVARSVGQTPAETLQAERAMYERLLAAVERMNEADLMDPGREFAAIPWKGARPLWDILAHQAWLHWEAHGAQLEAFARAREGQPDQDP